MSASAGGFVVIPGLLFLLALFLLAPGPLRMFGGAMMMLTVVALFFVWMRPSARPPVEAMPRPRFQRAVPVPAPPPEQVPVPVPEPEVVVPE